MDRGYLTNPNHGGKVTCHKCNGFILEGDGKTFEELVHVNDKPMGDYPLVWFHLDCFHRYEHYYGLNKPVD